jgi:hypothetical protein
MAMSESIYLWGQKRKEKENVTPYLKSLFLEGSTLSPHLQNSD